MNRAYRDAGPGHLARRGGGGRGRCASAHAVRVATDPVENTELNQGPQKVSATFNEALQPQFAAMTVVGPDGNLWSTGDPRGGRRRRQRRRATAGPVRHLHGELPGDVGGRPRGLRVVVVQAHGVRHGHARSVGVCDDPSSDGIPVWPFFVAAGLIVTAGAVWAVRRQR